VQVLNEVLLVIKEIGVGWVFAGKANFENVATMHERASKCKTMLVKTMDYQLHLLVVKLDKEHDIDDEKKWLPHQILNKKASHLRCASILTTYAFTY